MPAGWVSEWKTFEASDRSTKLFGDLWRKEPWSGPRALVILHGMGEHSGRYRRFPAQLRDAVDAIYIYDHRGHGRSEGLKGHIEDFDALAADAALVVRDLDKRLRERFGASEIHLFGHSLGGQVALRALLTQGELPIRSAIFSAPLLGVKTKVPFYKKAAAKLLAQAWGSLQIPTGIDPGDLSRDPEVGRAFVADRLNHSKMTPRFYSLMGLALADTLARPIDASVPTLFLVPEADRVVDPDVTLKYFERVKSPRKVLKTYPGFYHEPMNEPGSEAFFADLAAFIAEG